MFRSLRVSTQLCELLKTRYDDTDLKIHNGPLETLPSTQKYHLTTAFEIIEHLAPNTLPSFIENLTSVTTSTIVISSISKTLTSLLKCKLAPELIGIVPWGTHEYSKFVPPETLIKLMKENEWECVKHEEMRIEGGLLSEIEFGVRGRGGVWEEGEGGGNYVMAFKPCSSSSGENR